MTNGACPICGAVLTDAARATRPFCSARCRQIDLGKWLNEEYRVPATETPAEPGGAEDDGAPPPSRDAAPITEKSKGGSS